MSKYGVFYGPCFPVFGLNMEIYRVYNLQVFPSQFWILNGNLHPETK